MKALGLALAIVLSLCSSASAQCGVGRNLGLRQVVVGNQLLTVDRFGNVLRRQFLGRNALNVLGRQSLADRLLLGL